MYINMNEILDKFSQFTSSYKISFNTEIVNFKFSTKNLQNYSPYCLYIFRANKLPKEIFNYIIKNKELDKITIDKIKSLNISEEYIKGLESISLDNLDLNNIKNIDEIIKNIRKNSLNEKINMLLKEQIDIEKNKDVKDVKEVDSKIMEIALKIVELRRQLQRL